MAYWLFKTEPDEFGIDDLAHCADGKEHWNGVRNYQARNFMRDNIQIGDEVFIYHSSCKTIGIAGLTKVSQTGLVDPTQFDPESPYYDPKSTPQHPRWLMVEVQWQETFPAILPLAQIKQMPTIRDIGIVKKGHRLSIMPVQAAEFMTLLHAARNGGSD